MNKGLLFEWCVYYTVLSGKTAKPRDFTEASTKYKTSPTEVKKAATNAVKIIEKQFGPISDIEKISGGDEPKTDLVFTVKNKKLKCSMKFGGSIQLSSGGVSNTAKFLNKVLIGLKNDGYNNPKLGEMISALDSFEKKFGDLGKMPRREADDYMIKAERYDKLLKEILGTRRNPSVKGEYEKIKLAVVEEALTGKKTFGPNSIKTAEYILTEDSIRKIDKDLIKEIANKTSVRLALKGRGKVPGSKTRLNEIVVRFDTV